MIKRRVIISFVLILVLLISTTAQAEMPLASKDNNKNYDLYRWKMCESLDDLPQSYNENGTPVIFIYNGMYAQGNYNDWEESSFFKHPPYHGVSSHEISSNPQFPTGGALFAPLSYEFITRGNMNPFWIKWKNRVYPEDEDYRNSKYMNTKKTDSRVNAYQIFGSNDDGTIGKTCLAYEDKTLTNGVYFTEPDNKKEKVYTEWSITNVGKDGYENNRRKFHIYIEIPNEDDGCLGFDEDEKEFMARPFSWISDESQLFIYIGEKLTSNLLDSSVFGGISTPGIMQEFNGNLVIKKDTTLEIPKDTYFVVSGTIINEGTIKNNGVIIINEGGAILTMNSSQGDLKSTGGDILVLRGGFLYVPRNFVLENGSLINKGKTIIGSSVEIKNSVVVDDAYSYWGYNLTNWQYYPFDKLYTNIFYIHMTTVNSNVKCNVTSSKITGTPAEKKVNSKMKGI